MTTPKSPEQIMEEFDKIFVKLEMVKGIDETRAVKHFLRSSMASLLCYMAERMPEKRMTKSMYREGVEWEDDCDMIANAAIDDCRTLLIEEARKITGEGKTEEETEKIRALSNMLMFFTGKKPNE